MKSVLIDEDVKTRLILSGVSELEEHGVRDFSLRRAAEAAGVSCAAPYRYFKDKEDYLSRIFSHLASKWHLFFREVEHAWLSEPERCVTELCIASIRFWLANRNLRAALLVSGEVHGFRLADFDAPLSAELRAFFASRSVSEPEARVAAVRAVIYGYVSLIGSDELENSDAAFASARSAIARLLAP